MALTPDQIATREFAVGLRGYDQDEVRSFLKEVGDDFADKAAHQDAAVIRQHAAAEAEMDRARARAVLAAAQKEALRLVSEAHVRIDRRGGAAEGSAETAPGGSTVEQLGEQISAMVRARDEVLDQLRTLRHKVGEAVEVAEADPVVGRSSGPSGS
jgi:DivIVA domain-containing protein